MIHHRKNRDRQGRSDSLGGMLYYGNFYLLGFSHDSRFDYSRIFISEALHTGKDLNKWSMVDLFWAFTGWLESNPNPVISYQWVGTQNRAAWFHAFLVYFICLRDRASLLS